MKIKIIILETKNRLNWQKKPYEKCMKSIINAWTINAIVGQIWMKKLPVGWGYKCMHAHEGLFVI